MPHLSILDKACAIGQVEAGVLQNQVAALCGMSPGTISKLKAKFCETAKWASQEDNTPRRPVHHPYSTEEP